MLLAKMRAGEQYRYQALVFLNRQRCIRSLAYAARAARRQSPPVLFTVSHKQH
jgi:hypothetical protein